MRIKWNLSAFEEIRRLPKVDALLQDIVDDCLAELGEGYKGDVGPGKSRSRGAVWTADFEAILDNDENQSLLRAAQNARRN